MTHFGGWAAGVAAVAFVTFAAGCGSGPSSPRAAASPAASGATALAATTRAAVTATANPSTPASRPAAGATPPSPLACVPGQFGPASASFVSPNRGFLLGVTLTSCLADAASRIRLRTTTDRGLRWAPVSAPPAPWGAYPSRAGRFPADGVTSLLFADARDGWAYGPGLWATHDGGASWHRVGTAGRAVQSMAATGGHVVAVTLSCDPFDSGCVGPSFAIQASPADGDAWRPVPGATGLGTPTVTAGGGSAFAVVSPPDGIVRPAAHDSLLAGPADGSARWVSRPLPCTSGATAVSATTASRLVLSCARLGAHPAATHLYASADGGRHWTSFARLGLYDGADTVERTPGGTLLVAGIYNGAGISRDGGHTWTWPRAIDGTDNVEGGGRIEANLLPSDAGYVIVAEHALWITRDGGRTWRQVTVR